MQLRKSPYVVIIFVIPLLLGLIVLGYWYWTVKVERNTLLPNYGAVPQFALTAHTGSPFTNRDLRGTITIADFIFTSCAGSCPVMSMTMEELQDTFRTAPGLRFLSVSVDPEHDTPEILSRYAAAHHAIPGKWTFLTGARRTIVSLTRDGFHLATDVDPDSGIMHSEKFVLIDDDGSIRGYYDSGDESALHQLVSDARHLMRRLPS